MDRTNVLVKNYLYNAAYQVLVLLAPIVTAPYLARVLGAECLGIYGYISGVSSAMQTVMMLGLYTYGNRQIAYCRNNPRAVNEAFWELMFLRCACGFFGVLAYLVFALRSQYSIYAFAYLPWLIANVLDISWLFVGYENMKPTVMKNAGIKLISIVGIFTLIKSEDDLWLYFALISVGTLLGNLSIYPQARRYLSNPEFKFSRTLDHLKGSFALFLPEATASLVPQVNRIALGTSLSNASETGYYDQGDKIVSIPSTFVTVFSTVMMPRVAHEHSSGDSLSVSRYVIEAGKLALMVAIPLSFGIAGVAVNLVPWFLGPGFEAAVPVIIILSPMVILNCLIGITGAQYLTAKNETQFLTLSNTIGLILLIIFDALLISAHGAAGAAISIVVSRSAVSIIQIMKVRKYIPLNLLILPCFHYVIASLGMLGVIIVESLKFQHGAILTVVQFITGVMFYIVALLILKDSTFRKLCKAVNWAYRANR